MNAGGGGGGAVTVTTTDAFTLPVALVALNVYVVVAAGETDCDPFTATAAPLSVALVALDDVQVNVDD